MMSNIPKNINDVCKPSDEFEDESQIKYYTVKKR